MNAIIQKILLQFKIIQLQLQILILRRKLTVPNLPDPEYVVVHHEAGTANFWQVNEYHRTLWGFKSSLGFYIGYHKFIGYDGRLFIGRSDNEEGAHCAVADKPHFWNTHSVGICLQGNFENEQPTEAQLITLKSELDTYKAQGRIIKTHQEIKATLCPGKNLQKWVDEYRV